MNSFAIRTETAEVKQAVINQIMRRDPNAILDPEGNPITLWMDTVLSAREIEGIKGVEDCISSRRKVYEC